MPSLKKMQQRVDDLKVEWGEEPVTLRWYPGKLTDKWTEQLAHHAEQARAGNPSEAMPRIRAKLAELIAWWDLTQDEGPEGPDNPMVPISADSLGDIPQGLLLKIADRLVDEATGGEVSGRSGDGGNPVAPSDMNRDGPHSFS